MGHGRAAGKEQEPGAEPMAGEERKRGNSALGAAGAPWGSGKPEQLGSEEMLQRGQWGSPWSE